MAKALVTKAERKSLTLFQTAVLAALRKHGPQTQTALVTLLRSVGDNWRVRAALTALYNKHLVSKRTRNRLTKWSTTTRRK